MNHKTEHSNSIDGHVPKVFCVCGRVLDAAISVQLHSSFHRNSHTRFSHRVLLITYILLGSPVLYALHT